jgi:hypothetical protein
LRSKATFKVKITLKLQSFWFEKVIKKQGQWWNEDNKGENKKKKKREGIWQEVNGVFKFNQEEEESGFVLTRKSLS